MVSADNPLRRPRNYKPDVMHDLFLDKTKSLANLPPRIFIDINDVQESFRRLGWQPPGNVHNFFKDMFRRDPVIPPVAAQRGYDLRPGGGSNAEFVELNLSRSLPPWRVQFPEQPAAVPAPTTSIDPIVLALVRPGAYFHRHRNGVDVIAAEVKIRENLLYDQLTGIARAAVNQYGSQVHSIIPVGVRLQEDYSIRLAEFHAYLLGSGQPVPKNFVCYRLDPLPTRWRRERRRGQ